MKAYPFLINRDTSGQRLQPIESKEHGYDETWLQELLRTQPDILPVAEIEPIFFPMIPIGREVAVGTGAIDNLFISHRGYVILVETKLWRNPEAKREVVAQVIDYGSALSKWSFDRLNDATKEYTRKYAGAEFGLIDWVEKQMGPVEGGKDFFEDTAAKNLRLGRTLALIVGDRIRQSVVEMLNYVNQYPGLAMDVALVELQAYRIEKEHNWPLLIVPRIISRTEIIERSVVQVTVIDGKPPEIDVQQEKEKPGDVGRKPLTEEAFWELLRENTGSTPSQYDGAWNIIDDFRGENDIEIIPREGSIVVALGLPESGQQISLFFVSTKANLHVWSQTVARQLSLAGFDDTLSKDYEEQMRNILQIPKGRIEFKCHISKVDVEKFRLTVKELIRKVRLHENK
jgi:hypothetical protein